MVWREVCLKNIDEYHDWIDNRDTLDANDVVDALIEKLKSEGIKNTILVQYFHFQTLAFLRNFNLDSC